ncbi:MAG: MerR family transcriptional regulator [Myxococcota bacterium]
MSGSSASSRPHGHGEPTTRRAAAGATPRSPDEGSDRGAPRLFRTAEVVALLGVSRRQLQYWARTGLVEPSAVTPGGHRRYAFDDLVALRAAARLIDAGISVQRIRKSLAALRATLPEVERPLAECVLVATGDVVLVFGSETVFEAVSGQEWVFPVAELQRELDAFDGVGRATPVRRARTVRGRGAPTVKSA